MKHKQLVNKATFLQLTQETYAATTSAKKNSNVKQLRPKHLLHKMSNVPLRTVIDSVNNSEVQCSILRLGTLLLHFSFATSLSLPGNSGCLTRVGAQQSQEQGYLFLPVCTAFSCVQTMVWLPRFGIVNMRRWWYMWLRMGAVQIT